jgi:hypothetical protein
MTTISSFVNRLKKIGIQVELFGNYPWVYLDEVNGKKVTEKFMSNHGFTCFFTAIHPGEPDTITDIPAIFKQIRQILSQLRM